LPATVYLALTPLILGMAAVTFVSAYTNRRNLGRLVARVDALGVAASLMAGDLWKAQTASAALRVALEEHAPTCATCARALEQAAELAAAMLGSVSIETRRGPAATGRASGDVEPD